MTYQCKNCTAMVAWTGRLWTETDGRAHCQTGGLHVPDSHDVACCDPCIDGLSDPHYVQYRLQVLTEVPVGFTPHYDRHNNDGWLSPHQCATCYRTAAGRRRVVTLTPERPVMPATTVQPTYETSTVFVCHDCMTVVAHGPHPDDVDLAPHTPLNRLPEGYHLILGTDLHEFSHQACPTCTTPFAGNRYECTMMSLEPTICDECVNLVRHHH